MKRALIVALVLFAACKRGDAAAETSAAATTCLRCDAPRTTGALASDEMDETSGLAASSRFEHVYFAHNDSGDTARFFAIDDTGKRLATYRFSAAEVHDCEDMARGPCAPGSDQSCLYIGDIGDNARGRDHVVVYRVPEPATIADATLAADAFALTYPDGPHDAETLLVHPKTAAVTIVSKERMHASTMYEAPSPLAAGAMRRAGTVRVPVGSPRFTGGDVRADGTGILLRTYTHVFFAPMRPEETVAAALASPLCSLPVADEMQGEAIAWTKSGDGFLTVGEGKGVDVNLVHCAAP